MQQPSELHHRASEVDSAGKALALCLQAWDSALARRAPLAEELELQRRTHAAVECRVGKHNNVLPLLKLPRVIHNDIGKTHKIDRPGGARARNGGRSQDSHSAKDQSAEPSYHTGAIADPNSW